MEQTSSAETIEKYVDDDAEAKILRWKRGIEHGSSDPMYQDIEAMDAFKMTWDELMVMPERVFRSMVRIHGLKVKHEMRKQQMERLQHGSNG